MPVTGIKSKWVNGSLVFYPDIAGCNVQFGADAAGMDSVLYGDTTGASATWDASGDIMIFDKADLQFGDTDYLEFGDATGGDVSINWTGSLLQISPATNDTGSVNIGNGTKDIDAKIFLGGAAKYALFDVGNALFQLEDVDAKLGDGDILQFGDAAGGDVNVNWTGSLLQISPAANDTGSINVGDGTTDIDFKVFLGAATSYLLFDVGNKKLSGNGAATLQIGESTTGVTVAGGSTMIYGYANQKTNALTGNLRGVRGNAGVLIASAAGTVEGGAFRAANGSSTTATDGVNAGTLIGVSALVAGVGQAGPAVVGSAYGVYTQLDINAANLTVSDARGIYVNVQSGNDTANTLTACNLAYLEYESVVGTAPAINSAIKIATVGGATGATALIDASTFNLAVTDTDKVALIKFKDAAGTAKTVFYDVSDGVLSVG